MDAEAFRYVKEHHYGGLPAWLDERVSIIPTVMAYLDITLAEARQAIDHGTSPAQFNLACFRQGLTLFERTVHLPATPEIFKVHLSLYRTHASTLGEPAAASVTSFADMRSQLARAYFKTRDPLLKKYTEISPVMPVFQSRPFDFK